MPQIQEFYFTTLDNLGGYAIVEVGQSQKESHIKPQYFIGAVLTVGSTILVKLLTSSMTDQQSWFVTAAWFAAATILTSLSLQWQARTSEQSPEAIEAQVRQLRSELRERVQSRSYGARSKLIEAPLKRLDLDITPRVGWVRDPRLVRPKPGSEEVSDIIAAFVSSERRLLIVGEPGSGKTMAAYSLIEHLDKTEGNERTPLLVNLSAWGDQENFEAFLVGHLVSDVGYQVRKPAVASAFIHSRQYNLVLDGLDEIPTGFSEHFSERFDEFVRGLSSEVAVVVTCRTQEYEELLTAHPTGLGLVQAVEMLPLSSQQLDNALVELARFDKDWEALLSQQHLKTCQRARDLLSNPLFLNLAVVGHLKPRQLLECSEEQELRELVLERYLNRMLLNQSKYEPAGARRYLSWIARFLNGVEVSPFGLETTDATVFDLTNLTPPDPPWQYRVLEALGAGLVVGLFFGLGVGLVGGLTWGLAEGLGVGMLAGWPFRRSAVSSRLILVWPSTRQQLLSSLRRAGRGLVSGLFFGLGAGLVVGLFFRLLYGGLVLGLVYGLVLGLVGGLILGLVGWTFETRSVLITSRTPKEASSRSTVAALLWLVFGLVGALVGKLVSDLVLGLFLELSVGLFLELGVGLGIGLLLGIRNGGGFVVLQKVAYRHLARAGNLPPRPYDFLEWGIERQIFRRVGGGVRFRHSLLQQHLAHPPVEKLSTKAKV